MLHFLVVLQSLVSERLEGQRDRGATMIEYGLMVVGIAVVVGVAAAALGGRIVTLFDGVLPAATN